MIKASLLSRVAATVAAVVLLPATPALAARTAASSESAPVDLTGASQQGSHIGGGGSIVRTIVGLAIVIGVIYGVAWVLRQVKASRQPRATGSGLATLASIPLGPNRSVHLVRAGRDLVLLGVAEHGVVPIRTYTEEEAYTAGLIDEDGMLTLPEEETSGRRDRAPRRLPRLAMPQLALPSAVQAAREAARDATRPAAGRPARPGRSLALPAPRQARAATRPVGAPVGGVLDTLRSWTVRS